MAELIGRGGGGGGGGGGGLEGAWPPPLRFKLVQ